MESNSSAASDLPVDQARAQLEDLAVAQQAVAARVVTPSWYHPALAGLVFVFIAGNALPRWSMVTFFVYCAGLVWLVTTYRKLTGVWVSGWNVRGGRGYAWLLLAVLLAALGVSYAVRWGDLEPWCAWAAAATSALVTWWAGRRLDTAFRAHLQTRS